MLIFEKRAPIHASKSFLFELLYIAYEENDYKQFLFNSRKIRAEGRTPLRRAFECVYLIKLLLKPVQLT